MSDTRLKAEMWDKTQYFLSNFYDRMMHYAIFYDGIIDEKNMQYAIKTVVDKTPVMRSKYVPNFIVPYWKVTTEYELSDMATLIQSNNIEDDTYAFLKGDISHKDKLQFRCRIFTDGKKSSFAFLINHQCFDGSDFKYVMFKIVECYNAICKEGNADNVQIKTGTRKLSQLYRRMTPESSAKAKKLYNNASKMGVENEFKFTADKDCVKRFMFKIIEPELFNKMKLKGKENNASINDVLLAAYFRALAKEAGYAKDRTLNITSMMDLRRHFADGKGTEGATNMTAFMPCKIDGIGETFIDTLKKVEAVNNAHKENDVAGLYGIPLLALAYKIFIDGIARIAIKIGYDNPKTQMSNLGIMKGADVNLTGATMYDCFMTGAVKYKPYFQLTCVTREGNMKLCIAEKCSDADEKLINQFLDYMVDEINEFVK